MYLSCWIIVIVKLICLHQIRSKQNSMPRKVLKYKAQDLHCICNQSAPKVQYSNALQKLRMTSFNVLTTKVHC